MFAIEHIQSALKSFLDSEKKKGNEKKAKTGDPMIASTGIIKNVFIVLHNPASATDNGQMITFKLDEIILNAPPAQNLEKDWFQRESNQLKGDKVTIHNSIRF